MNQEQGSGPGHAALSKISLGGQYTALIGKSWSTSIPKNTCMALPFRKNSLSFYKLMHRKSYPYESIPIPLMNLLIDVFYFWNFSCLCVSTQSSVKTQEYLQSVIQNPKAQTKLREKCWAVGLTASGVSMRCHHRGSCSARPVAAWTAWDCVGLRQGAGYTPFCITLLSFRSDVAMVPAIL